MDALNLLKETGAILEGHFLLTSGKHSDTYVQCAKLLRYPDKAEKVVKQIVKKIEDLQIDKVVGPAMGGIIVSYEIGRQLKRESLFTERKDRQMQLRRGFEIKRGDRILIAEDVITTGKSTLETKDVIEALGGVVVGLGCIVDRTENEVNFPIYSAVKMKIQTYSPENCPICKTDKELIKPGSREKI